MEANVCGAPTKSTKISAPQKLPIQYNTTILSNVNYL